MKNILVVYFSRDGHTELIAQEIASALDAELDEIKDHKKRKGWWAYIFAGRDALYKKLTKIAKSKKNPKKFELVIIGTPIWSWDLPPAIRTYLTENKKDFTKVAFFCTRGASNTEKVFQEMEEIIDKKAIATVGFIQKEVEQGKCAPGIISFLNKLN